MGDKTGIEWTDATWNPIRGCSRVSEGCRHCYAETVAKRFSGPGGPYEGLVTIDGKWNGKIRFIEDHLLDPLKWKKPRRIFVNSMSDLFHPGVTDEMLNRIFVVMATARQHTFQVLTKRPERMLAYTKAQGWELPNVWLGVSVENQKAADERIPLLLQTSAAKRFISAEPLLGNLDIDEFLQLDDSSEPETILDWVICGGESGPGARPMHPDWAFSLRDQCVDAGVPFFFKQWGEWASPGCEAFGKVRGPIRHMGSDGTLWNEAELPQDEDADVLTLVKVGKKSAGHMLGNQEWHQFPETRP